MPPLQQSKSLPVRTVRLVLTALAAGIVILAITAVIVQSTSPMTRQELEIPIYSALALLTLSSAMGYSIVRAQLLRRLANDRARALEALDRHELPAELSQLAIIRAALIESVGLFGGVAYLVLGTWVALVIPVVSCAAILGFLPDEERARETVRSLQRE